MQVSGYPRADVSPAVLMDIVRTLPDVLFRCVKHEGKIYWTLNEGGLAEEFGLRTKDIEGKPLEALFPGGASDAIKEHFEAAFEGHRTQFVNEIDGRFFKHFPQPVYVDGQVEAVVGFISEVTDLVLAERRLQQANEDLKAFAHTASHDLRTPLTVIQTLAQVLERSPLAEPEAQAVQKILHAARGMGEMMEALLAFSKAAQSPLRMEEVNVTAMARDIEEQLSLRFADHRVRFEVDEGLAARADPPLLRMVLENLLSNAWKFTQGADAVVSITHAEGVWSVSDNGVGFASEAAEALFDPFQRLETAFEGTGIGLATVRRIVERHGGRVWAQSAPGEGSTFCFTLEAA